MPFGVFNAAATFQRMMTKVLQSIPQSEEDVVFCYVNDILIATTTIEQHMVKLNQVLQRLKQAGLTFLGRVIGGGSAPRILRCTPPSLNGINQEPRRNSKVSLTS